VKDLYHFKVISFRVIDGDTVEATIDQGFHTMRKEAFRLARINAPEMNTEAGVKAKYELSTKLFQGTVTLSSIKTEKYGRWLAEVYVGDENVNDWLVEQGFAKPYGSFAKSDGEKSA
jgi:micrococcal nuclease